MTLFVGLDGGASGCRARALRPDGTLSAIVEGGSANIHADPIGAQRRLADTLARVLNAEQWTDPASPDLYIVLGLAGASETGASQRLPASLPYRKITILGDIETSLSGAFEDDDGIVMAVGTGSVLARQVDGQMQRIGGYGFALGDEASGAWMGRRALSAALHVRDGLCLDAPLAQAVWARFAGLSDLLDFVASARPADYASFAPQIVSLDKTGCAISGRILDEGCAYLLRAIRHLQAGNTELPVAAAGGLGQLLLDRMATIATPALHTVAPKGTALDGALWRARKLAQTQGQKV